MIYLKFSADDMRPVATDEEWRRVWEWGVHAIGNAPEVYQFVDSGISKDLPALTEQLEQAARQYPPKDAATRQRVKELRLHLDRATSSAVVVTDGEPEQPSELHKAFAALHNLATQQAEEIGELKKQLHELASKQMLTPVINLQMPPDGIHLHVPAQAIADAMAAISFPAPVVNVAPAEVTVPAPVVNVAAAQVNVPAPIVQIPENKPRKFTIGKDETGKWFGSSE